MIDMSSREKIGELVYAKNVPRVTVVAKSFTETRRESFVAGREQLLKARTTNRTEKSQQ